MPETGARGSARGAASAGSKSCLTVESIPLYGMTRSGPLSVASSGKVGSWPVEMAEIPFGVEAIPHALLQRLDVREAPVSPTLPHRLARYLDREGAARARDQGDLPQIVAESGEK